MSSSRSKKRRFCRDRFFNYLAPCLPLAGKVPSCARRMRCLSDGMLWYGEIMVLIINTTSNNELSNKVNWLLNQRKTDFEVINTADMNIDHCIGCNHCWLKDPGICAIKDDSGAIVQKIVAADQVWVISDTALGFLNHNGKKIFDRIIPILCIYLEFRGDQMRHITRYAKPADLGLIYQGEAEQAFLQVWLEKCAVNMNCHSLGAYPVTELKEAAICMH